MKVSQPWPNAANKVKDHILAKWPGGPVKALALAAALAGCMPSQRSAAFATVATVTLAVDWAQTRGYVATCREGNPLLGRCGEGIPVDVYFPLVIVGMLALGPALGDWESDLYATMAGIEAATVVRNAMTP